MAALFCTSFNPLSNFSVAPPNIFSNCLLPNSLALSPKPPNPLNPLEIALVALEIALVALDIALVAFDIAPVTLAAAFVAFCIALDALLLIPLNASLIPFACTAFIYALA